MPAIRAVLQKAMQERAPAVHRQVAASGQLEPTLDQLVAGYEQSVDDAMSAATDSPTFEPDPNRRAQQFAMRRLTAERTALEQAAEQIDALSPITATSPVS